MEYYKFEAELLIGRNTCERCGGIDEMAHRVKLTKGKKSQEQILCGPCTFIIKRRVVEKNNSIKKANSPSHTKTKSDEVVGTVNNIDYEIQQNTESNESNRNLTDFNSKDIYIEQEQEQEQKQKTIADPLKNKTKLSKKTEKNEILTFISCIIVLLCIVATIVFILNFDSIFNNSSTTETTNEQETMNDYSDYNYDYDDDSYDSYSTTKSYSYITTGDTHSCNECGRTASYSITGLNGQKEWYCYEHWKEMNDMYEYLLNN